jgi:hypothetical protein
VRRAAPLFQTALAALFFLVATILFTWPIAPHINDGLADLWDAKFTAWVLHWDYHQVFHDPLHLYDANIFYPARYTLAFSENLFGAALFAFPLYAAGVSTLAAYNLIFLLGVFLSALSAWALARYVTGDAVASLFAGLVYAFVPWRMSQIPHIQFQWGAFLALSLLFLLKYLDEGRRRQQALFALLFAWNAATNVHYAIFSALLLALVLAYEGVARTNPEIGHRAAGSLLAAALAGLVVLPLYVPYATASRLYGLRRHEGEIEFFSGRPIDFLTAGWQNKLYGPLTQAWGHPEGDFFPGLITLVLGVTALLLLRRSPSTDRRSASAGRTRLARLLDFAVAGGFVLWVLVKVLSWDAIGPVRLRDPGRLIVLVTEILFLRLLLAFPAWSRFADLRDFLRRMRLETRAGLFLLVTVSGALIALGMHTPYYRFLVESFGPAFRVIRVPSRGIVLFDLGLAVLASWGLSKLPHRRWIAAGAILLTTFEYRAFPVRTDAVEQTSPPVDRWLAGVEVSGSVVEWPFATTGDQVEYQFRSTAHWKPLINGYSGFFPPTYQELAAVFDKKAMLEKKAIRPDVWEALEERHCRLLIVHPHMIEEEPIRRVYLATLREGLEQGRLHPVKVFPRGSSSDLVFELRRKGSEPGKNEGRMEASLEAWRALETLEKALNPPFGFLDWPRPGEITKPGASGFGWALDDSGIQSVLVAVDGGPSTPAVLGLSHPGLPQVYPNYPGVEHGGFSFTIPNLLSGIHTLTVTIVAKDGGTVEIKRSFLIP